MLAVRGVGMVSSLGLDAATSCAAARAGLRRTEPLAGVYDMDLEEGEQVPVVGHQVPLVAPGFFGFARLTQLGVAAMEDLQTNAPGAADGRVGFILLAGSSAYQHAWLELARTNPDEDPDEIAEEQARLEAADQRINDDLLATIVRRTGLLVEPSLTATIRSTSVGLIAALGQAWGWLNSGACDRCVVGAIDSLVDPAALAVLLRLGLLKTVNHPVGMMPGEAAAFHVLQLARGASERDRAVAAIIETPLVAKGVPNPRIGARPGPRRETLVNVLAETIANVYQGRFGGVVLASLNGDVHRAQAWADALIRLRGSHDIGARPTWLPAAAFGETGAAAGCVSIAMLARSWARRYAPSSQALVCLQDDFGGRGVIPVRAPTH